MYEKAFCPRCRGGCWFRGMCVACTIGAPQVADTTFRPRNPPMGRFRGGMANTPNNGSGRLVFRKSNGTLMDHPITKGIDEVATFAAQLTGEDRHPMGMNAAIARQNPQFVLSVMHWLTNAM